MIQGLVIGKMPIEAVPLQPEQRQKFGLPPSGLTLFYPAGEDGVFIDLEQNDFTVWFSGDDCEGVTSALHTALTRVFPKVQQLDEVPHPRDSRMKARVYRVDLGGGRLAAISTEFGQVGAKRKFTARIKAQQRPG